MNNLYVYFFTATGTLIAGIILTLIIKRFSGKVLSKITSRTKSTTDDYIAKAIIDSIKPLGFLVSLSIAWTSLLPSFGEYEIKTIENIVLGLIELVCLVIVVRLFNKIILRLINSWAIQINDNSVSSMLNSISPMVRALVWCIGSIFYLQNIGVQMTAIWALLSAGGIGAGLALKEPVQEFFEYITILLDKPFQNGQFIHIDNIWAKVERVGVRSTRLRSINGEIIVMSNSRLTSGVISNYAEMERRRLVHKLGVIYDTPHRQMERIPEIIKTIIDDTENAVFDRCHFTNFGNSSLDFELVYYIPTSTYILAMKAQQEINLKIMKKFEEENISFAFPTQTINLNK
tara:strand:- start:2827 stop:3861 length:1035 start_codon:yes stop_codon:yes gene_type:complete